MGLSASQARFLQLTARRSNIEYEAQQINFQRLQWSDKLAAASSKYNEATMNRQMIFSFNTGEEVKEVPISYTNFKNYMNQQMEGLSTTHEKYYLMSSSGNKIVVASEEERDKMIADHTVKTSVDSVLKAREDIKTVEAAENNPNLTEEERENLPTITEYTRSIAAIDLDKATVEAFEENGENVEYVVECPFEKEDFMIVDDLDDVSNFQKAIQDGVYFFARFNASLILTATGISSIYLIS